MGTLAARIMDTTAHGGMVTVGYPTVIIGNMPAARIGDLHTCPMANGPVPHVGGPFVLGAFNVLVGMMPQSRVTDMLICVGPPDTLVQGCPTVVVGMAFSGGMLGVVIGLALAGFAMLESLVSPPYPRSTLNPDGTLTTQISPSVTLVGTPAFTVSAIRALNELSLTRTGAMILKAIADKGHHLKIQETKDANGYCAAANYTDAADPKKGSDSTISWNPNHNTVDAAAGDSPGSTVILGHEMVHAYHNATGTYADGPNYSYDSQNGSSQCGEERSTVGAAGTSVQDPAGNTVPVKDYSSDVPTENSLRDDMGIPRRSTYYPSNWPGGAPW